MNNLLWQTIPNYTSYEAHPDGYVRNKTTQRIMRSECKKHKYISLFLNNQKMVSLHRLIAITFLPNLNNLSQVNHMDGNRRNNAVSNLEWISPSDNVKHAISMGRKENSNSSKPVRVTMKDNTTLTFNSFTEAAKHLHVNIGAIQHCLKTDGIYCGKTGLRDKTDDKWLWKLEKIENEPHDDDENNIIKEITVDRFTHLMACSNGNIYNKTTQKTVGCCDGRYIRVKSSVLHSKTNSTTAHQLIAQMFIPNPENKPFVNHIDGNTKNNSVSNLEWCTQQENMIHAITTGLINTETKKSSKLKRQEPVYLLELNGAILNTFDSFTQISQYMNCNASYISMVCQKHNHTIKGVGCCSVRKYKKEYNKTFLDLFPELENREDIHYDILRNYIIRGARPIFQVDIDGTFIKRWESQVDAANDMKLCLGNINNCCTKYGKHLYKGYFWRFVTYEELLNSSYKKEIPSIVKTALQIPFHSDVNIKPDIVNLLRENMNEKGQMVIKTRPIVQMTIQGEFIKCWSGPTVARKQLEIGRNQIEQVLFGKCTSSNGYKWRFLTLEEMVE